MTRSLAIVGLMWVSPGLASARESSQRPSQPVDSEVEYCVCTTPGGTIHSAFTKVVVVQQCRAFVLDGMARAVPGRAHPSGPGPDTLIAEAGVEHLWPNHLDRQIATTSANLLVGRNLWRRRWLAWRAGLTLTYANGYILQFDERFRDVRFDTSAGGVGPAGSLRLQTPEQAGLRLALEASGGLLLYTRRFPAGGDIYNFMWRVGPSLEARVGRSFRLGAGIRWMHVSNGQGLRPQNPAYNSRGLSIWLSRPL